MGNVGPHLEPHLFTCPCNGLQSAYGFVNFLTTDKQKPNAKHSDQVNIQVVCLDADGMSILLGNKTLNVIKMLGINHCIY